MESSVGFWDARPWATFPCFPSPISGELHRTPTCAIWGTHIVGNGLSLLLAQAWPQRQHFSEQI